MPVFIESHILNAFVTFAGQGTLTKTSEVLGISQPALTQSMKKLEDIIGVRLFHRSKNKMTLNENGMLVLDYARQIMALQEKMIGEVREKDARSHIIRYGSIAPGPIFELTPRLTQFFVGRTLQSEVKEAKEPLLEGLDDGTYDFVVLLDQPDGYFSKKLFEEHLSIFLPKGHRLARRKSIEMKELDGETLLLMDGLGFWKELIHRHHQPLQDSQLRHQHQQIECGIPSIGNQRPDRRPHQRQRSPRHLLPGDEDERPDEVPPHHLRRLLMACAWGRESHGRILRW